MAPNHYEEDKSPKGLNGTLREENQENRYNRREKLEKQVCGNFFF